MRQLTEIVQEKTLSWERVKLQWASMEEANAPPEVYFAAVEEADSSTPTAVQIQPSTKEPMIPAMTL